VGCWWREVRGSNRRRRRAKGVTITAVRAAIVGWEDVARRRVKVAADTLAGRLGVPVVEWANRARHQGDPSPTSQGAGDMETLAILAEAVVRLGEELDALRQGAVKPTAKKGAGS